MSIDRITSLIAESEQILLKKSRDDKYEVLAVMALGEDGNTARRIKVDSSGSVVTAGSGSLLPTDGNNPSLVLTYTDGNLTKITKIIGGVNYEKTLTYTDGSVTGVSAWSEV